MLNWIDFVIIGFLTLSVLISITRGLVRETLSLITWIAAFYIALTFSKPLAQLLVGKITSPTAQMAVAFGSLFLASLLVGSLLNYLISKLVDKTGLTGTDRLLGIVFGIGRGILLVTLLLLLANLTPMPKEPSWKKSLLIPKFQPIEIWLQSFLPESMHQSILPLPYRPTSGKT